MDPSGWALIRRAGQVDGSQEKRPDEPQESRETGPLHRLAAIRRRRQLSLDDLAQRLNMTVEQVKSQEQATSDMMLGALYRWAEALGVSITDVLVEGEPAGTPRLKRGQAVRILATARAICQRAQRARVQRMAQTLIDQLVELMPALKNVRSPAHDEAQRAEATAVISIKPLPESLFIDSEMYQ